MSLVNANLITKLFEPNELIPQTFTNQNMTRNSIKPSELCNKDFGCDRNVCWRSCDVGSTDKNSESPSWCYTTSTPGCHVNRQCIYAHDCSPCWECAIHKIDKTSYNCMKLFYVIYELSFFLSMYCGNVK